MAAFLAVAAYNVLPRIRLSPLTLCSFALFLFPLFRILSILVSVVNGEMKSRHSLLTVRFLTAFRQTALSRGGE
jgi:hypothetical protein